jgi:hypothetical protein
MASTTVDDDVSFLTSEESWRGSDGGPNHRWLKDDLGRSAWSVRENKEQRAIAMSGGADVQRDRLLPAWPPSAAALAFGSAVRRARLPLARPAIRSRAGPPSPSLPSAYLSLPASDAMLRSSPSSALARRAFATSARLGQAAEKPIMNRYSRIVRRPRPRPAWVARKQCR